MKRDPALAPLSRDHHQALVVARALTRAAPDAGAARARFLDYWDRHGRAHFRAEEELLLPAYARHVGAHHRSIARALCDHVAIRALAERVAGEPPGGLDPIVELGVELALHVRFEERELFPAIERTLPADALAALADALDRAEREA
jgi:hypothetical protein